MRYLGKVENKSWKEEASIGGAETKSINSIVYFKILHLKPKSLKNQQDFTTKYPKNAEKSIFKSTFSKNYLRELRVLRGEKAILK